MLSFLKQEPGFYGRMYRLAVPIVLQNIINSGLALADTFMVGVLGEAELAAVTLANNVFFVLIIMGFGIQSGMAVLISQYWGRGDNRTISRVIGLGLYVSGGIAALFVAAVMCFPAGVMHIATSDTELAAIGAPYLSIVAPAFFMNMVSMTVLGAFRSMENPRVGLAVLALSMGVNTLLNYMLIFGNFGAPELGVKGAALATLISRVLEILLTAGYLLINKYFRVDWRAALRPGMYITKQFGVYGIPVIINETMWGLGFTLYPIIAGHMEGAASGVAAFTVALNVDRVLGALFFGTGGAAAVIIGKHLGAEGSDASPESRRTAYDLGKAMLLITGAVGVAAGVLLTLTAAFAAKPFLTGVMGMEDGTASLARVIMFINALNMPVRALNFTVIVGILRGGGDVKAAAVIDIAFLYLIGLPFAFVAGLILQYGVMFIFLGMLIEESTKLFISLRRFKARVWVKNVTV